MIIKVNANGYGKCDLIIDKKPRLKYKECGNFYKEITLKEYFRFWKPEAIIAL